MRIKQILKKKTGRTRKKIKILGGKDHKIQKSHEE